MFWLTNLNLKPKLLAAFASCVLITIVVGALGQSGITELYQQVQYITSNSLESIKKIGSVKPNLVATNRDFYKAIILTTSNADQSDIDAVLQSYRDNQAEALQSFEAYRTTPLEPGEQAAGDDFERVWPACVTALEAGFAALKNDEAGTAKNLATS